MLFDIKGIIQKDTKLRYILFAGLILQLAFSLSTTGFYHADQHFQIIEFSSYQLGEPNATPYIWEFDQAIRPTLQVYLFSAYRSLLHYTGFNDPYNQLTLMRIIMGLLNFILFNLICIYYTKTENKKVLYLVLIMLNFSWCLPYIKTLFSSEMLSSFFFFGTVFLYEIRKDREPNFAFLALTGFLLCLTFYIRFQSAFLILGFIIWIIFILKKRKHLFPIAAGFAAGVLLNTWLDYGFYHQLVITPYEYYYSNIVLKKAATFGTSGPYLYIGVLLATTAIFPVSLFLYYYAVKACRKKYNHLLFITILLFILAHSIVRHKEERFMFPILCILPVITGWGIPAFIQFYNNCKRGMRTFIKCIIGFSIVLNSFLLYVLMFHNPATQLVDFTSLLNNHINKSGDSSKLYCLGRTPFITSFRLPIAFYSNAFKKKEIVMINDIDSIRNLKEKNIYLATTFGIIKNHRSMMDSLGFKPVAYSSGLLWKINEFLYQKKRKGVLEIWVLYKKMN